MYIGREQVQHLLPNGLLTNYLVTLIQHKWNPGKFKRRATSISRSALEIDQPWELLLFFSRLGWVSRTADAACKEPHSVSIIWSGVIQGDIKEELADAESPWDAMLALRTTDRHTPRVCKILAYPGDYGSACQSV